MATEKGVESPKSHDWNAKARIIYIERKGEENEFKESDRLHFKWEGEDFGCIKDKECAIKSHPDAKDLQQFLDTNSKELRHGDLLTTSGQIRASGTYIVVHDPESNKFKAVLNPDEGGSGYLTLPEEVLKNVTDVMEKYEEIFNHMENDAINIHISPKDNFITERLGKEVDEKWQFDLHMLGGEVEESYVRSSDKDEWQDFDIEDSSIETIAALFDTGEKTSFTVEVELKDDKFEAYKKKYGKERAKYGWMHEKPSLPSKWMAEKGTSSGGSTFMKWEWIFKGPSESVSEAKAAVETFLTDFNHKYKEEKDQ